MALKWGGLAAAATVLATLIGVCPAQAAPPTARLVTAPLVAPGDAFANASTTHTAGVAAASVAPPEIKALARSLGADRIGAGPGQMTQAQFVADVFAHIRANVATEFRFGLAKGGVGALIDESGTPFDQAELMVKLLAEGGVTASYKAGTITLTSQEFGLWTGFVKNLSEAAQTFDVDAAAACQFLADGGIGASCSGTGGNLSSVTLAHVWVDVGGVAYDPSYKVHRLRAGLDLAAAMGCSGGASGCASAATTTATSQAVQGTYGGNAQLPTLSGLKGTEFGTLLTGYAQSLQAAIEASAPDAPVESATGGKTLAATQSTYAAAGAAVRTWSDGIPDPYRTVARFQFHTIDQTLYADELGGRRLSIHALVSAGTAILQLELDSDQIASANYFDVPGPLPITLSINAPYPASGGTYGDVAADFANMGGSSAVLLSFGDTSGARARYFAAYESTATPAAQYAAQASRAGRLIGDINRTAIINHATFGLVGDLYDIGVVASATSQTGDAAKRGAAFRAFTLLTSTLEGSAPAQSSDAWYAHSTATGFATINRLGGTFVDIPYDQYSAVSGALAYVSAYYAPHVQPQNRILATLSPPGGGYSLAIQNGTVIPSLGGFLVYSDSAEGYWAGQTKGGSAPASGVDPAKDVLDSLRQSPAARRAAFSADVATGALNFSPPPDLVTGAGAFPFSLPLQRSLSSPGLHDELGSAGESSGGRLYYGGPDASVAGRLGGGWQHNFQISARLNNDGLVGLGSERAFDAAAAIAGLTVLGNQGASPSFQDRLTAMLTADWIVQQFFGNTVTVSLPPASRIFVRRVGTAAFRGPAGSAETLAQTGVRSGPVATEKDDPQSGGGVRAAAYDYRNVTFTLTRSEGDTIALAPNRWSRTQQTAVIGDVGLPSFAASHWDFPNGLRIDFLYDNVNLWPYTTAIQEIGTPIQLGLQLREVTNSLGRSLTFANTNLRVTGVTDDANRTVTYGLTCGPNSWLSCDAFTSTSPEGRITKYEYASDAYNPFARPHRSSYRLVRWFTPSNPTTPLLSFDYDELYRLKTTTDALGRVTKLYPAAITGSERLKRGETLDALNAASIRLFDDKNRTLQATDAIGRSAAFAYDDAGRLIRTTYPEGNAETRTYDVRGNMVQICQVAKARAGQACDPVAGDLLVQMPYPEVGAVICVSPVTCNRPLGTIDPLGRTTTYAWNASGYLSLVTRPAAPGGLQPEDSYGFTSYPADGETITLPTSATRKISGTESTTTAYAYDANGKFVLSSSTVDPGGLGLVTTYGYDSVGNLASIDGPRAGAGDTTLYVWDSDRRLRLTAEPDPDGAGSALRAATKLDYTPDGEVQTTERGASSAGTLGDFTALQRAASSYDLVGNKQREVVYDGVTTAILSITDMSYDPVNRLQCTAVRMSLADAGNPGGACAQRSTGTPDRLTRNTYDVAGQLTMIEHGVSSPVAVQYSRTAYTLNGKQDYVADSRGNKTSFRYDGFDRLVRTVFPSVALPPNQGEIAASDETNYEEYGYDKAANRTSFRRRSGAVFTYVYDGLNRMVEKHAPSGSGQRDVYFAYDLVDRMTEARFDGPSGADATILAYDKAGRLTSDTTFGRTVTSLYDPAGAPARTAIVLPDSSSFSYEYDPAGRMTYVRENGQMTGYGVLAQFQHDDLGRRKRMDRGNGGYAVSTYDGAGRLASLEQKGGTSFPASLQTLSFNPAAQVATMSQAVADYVWQGSPPVTPSRAYDGLNRDAAITLISSGYDANGNLANDGIRKFTFDLENRLIKLEPAPGQTGPSMDIAYDPTGRLASTTIVGSGLVTNFVYDGDRLVAEYGASGPPLRRYVHGPGVDEPLVWYEGSIRHWLHADRQGSIIAESTDSGSTTAYTYGPWGEPNDWGTLRFRYTGQIALHEAQLYHYKARVYDPLMGRFLQTDPIGFDGGDINLYAYVGNDPINSADPSGMVTGSYLGTTTGAVSCIGECNIPDDRNKSTNEASFWGALGGSGTAIKATDLGQNARRYFDDAVEGTMNAADRAALETAYGISRLAGNKQAGRTGEELAVQNMRSKGYRVLATQVYVRDGAGRLRIYDAAGFAPDGRLTVMEFKTGGAARNGRQVTIDESVRTSGGRVVNPGVGAILGRGHIIMDLYILNIMLKPPT